MEATARIVAEAGPRGTRLTVLRGEAPLLPRRTGPGEVHLVGGAAGPLGGDRLRLELEVGPGACLRVRTVAATLALPGPGGAESHSGVHATVADGGRLEWLPEPVIAARGCRHRSSSIVELSAGARLLWREELITGRHREECGDLVLSTLVRRAGRTLLHQDLAVGPRSPEWDGPAALGGARAAGSLLQVDPLWTPPPPATAGDGWARMPLAGPALLTTAVAADAHALRGRLAPGATPSYPESGQYR